MEHNTRFGTSMLALSEIEQLLRSGEIEISYAFAQFGQEEPVYLGDSTVDVSNPEKPATRMFLEHFFGDRLLVTLGPIGMTHDAKYARKRPAFKNRRGYFDIRDTANTLVLEPHETVSLATNERIRLGGTIGAYVLPRLRNVDAGLVYTTSYIDPFWDGLLQAVVVNVTDQRQTLTLCEGLAQVRFYPIKGYVPEDTQRIFPKKSHHYGQSWLRILNEDYEPFPRRKFPQPGRGAQRAAAEGWWFVQRNWPKAIATGYVGGVLALLLAYTRLQTTADQVTETRHQLSELAQQLTSLQGTDLPALKTGLNQTTARIPRSGRTLITVPQGSTFATTTFEVSRSLGDTTTVWAEPEDSTSERITVTARIDPSPTDVSKLNLTITISNVPPGDQRTFVVKWLLAA